MNLFILRQAPYQNSLAREALDMALAFAAFDQEICLLFMGDGVFQLLEYQDTQNQGVRNIAKTLDSLSLFDINKVYVCHETLRKKQLDITLLKPLARSIQASEIEKLISLSDKVFNF